MGGNNVDVIFAEKYKTPPPPLDKNLLNEYSLYIEIHCYVLCTDFDRIILENVYR